MEFVQMSKDNFLAKASSNGRILNVLRTGGVLLSVGGLGISAYKFSRGEIGGLELTADAVFTGVAIWGGPVGWVASTMYFGGKIAIDGKPTLKSDVGGYDISRQNTMRHPYFVPKR